MPKLDTAPLDPSVEPRLDDVEAAHEPPGEQVLSPSAEPPKQCPRCRADNASDAAHCAACGVFLPGHTESLKHGGRRRLDRPEALAAIAGKRDELIQHLGGEPSIVQSDLVTDYARVDVLIESVARNLEVGGIFTPKGAARAAVGMLLSLMDRRLRLATTLGIERKAKPVVSLSEVMDGK